jgi:hypothetical protein
MPRGPYECMTCRQHLHGSEFYTLRPRSGRRECKMCCHQRLAREHSRAFDRLCRMRQSERVHLHEQVIAARAVLGRD